MSTYLSCLSSLAKTILLPLADVVGEVLGVMSLPSIAVIVVPPEKSEEIIVSPTDKLEEIFVLLTLMLSGLVEVVTVSDTSISFNNPYPTATTLSVFSGP